MPLLLLSVSDVFCSRPCFSRVFSVFPRVSVPWCPVLVRAYEYDSERHNRRETQEQAATAADRPNYPSALSRGPSSMRCVARWPYPH